MSAPLSSLPLYFPSSSFSPSTRRGFLIQQRAIARPRAVPLATSIRTAVCKPVSSYRAGLSRCSNDKGPSLREDQSLGVERRCATRVVAQSAAAHVARMAAVQGDGFPRDRVRLQRHPLLQERPCRLRPYNLTRFDNADDAHWREV